MKKFILLAFLFLAILAIPVLALQEGEAATTFDPAVVELILLGIGGLTVVGITQLIKTWLKVEGAAGYIISAVVSAGATAYVLITTHIFPVVAFIGYSLFVFLAANGIYKVRK